MSQTDDRQACSECHSKDNLCFWTYDGKQFQKCVTPGCSAGKAKCISSATDQSKRANYTDVINGPSEFLTGDYKDTRGLSVKTCQACGIMVQGNNHIFQYKNAQKVRFPKGTTKGMYWIGDSKDAGLFLEHLGYDVSKPIVVTEGEFDAASCYEAGYQAYSIKDGAGETKTAEEIRRHLPRLSEFKEIIFWFDSDKAGLHALKEVLEIEGLPLHKVRIAQNSLWKDANEMLQNGDLIGLQLTISEAKEYIPEGLQQGCDLDFNVLEKAEDTGIPFPFPEMQNCYHGLRKGEILLLGAGSGAGKSLFAKHLVVDWLLKYPELRIANIFLEEKQKFTLQSLLSIYLQTPAYKLVEEPYAGLAQQGKEFLGRSNLWFDNHFGSLKSKELFKKIRFLAFKTDVIILDHISIIVSGMEGNDERKDIDRLMTRLKTIAVETGVRFVLISHLRRANGDATYEQGMPITSNSFRGSHSLYQLSDSVIALERDQQDSINKNKVKLRGLKNRFKGEVGLLDDLYFIEDCGILKPIDKIFE